MKIVRVAIALTFGLLVASSGRGQSQTNTDTNCNGYGDSINCTSTSTTTQTGPTPAQVEQQKEMNENMQKTGAALGSIVAMKRAQHEQEKNDLTAVTFCRQNPDGSWSFPNKAPMPCATLEKNLIAYCTVNAKKQVCKDVAKLPPARAVSPDAMSPDEERVTVNVVYCQLNPTGIVTTSNRDKKGCADEIAHVTAVCTVRGWKGKPCDALSNKKTTAIVANEATQTQPQTAAAPQQQPISNTAISPPPTLVATAPESEVSVAEAARQARIAKAVREAKEKAERDNPAPSQP